MATPADDATPSTPALVEAARKFLAALKDTSIPNGYVKDTMPESDMPAVKGVPTTKGLKVILKALGHFIEAKQDLVAIEANRALVERLRGTDGVDIADMIINIAIGNVEAKSDGEDEALPKTGLHTRQAELRKALMIGNESIFDRLRLAINNIGRDKRVQLEDNDDQERGGFEIDPRDAKRGPSKESKDKGTWAESIHDTDKPKVSDDELRKAAEEHDRQGGAVNEADIRKSAQGGPADFVPTDKDKTEYERSEGGDGGYFGQQTEEIREIKAYVAVASKLTKEFKTHMATPLIGRPGMSGGPPGS